MAQPGEAARAAIKKVQYLHFRADEELVEQVETYAEAQGVTRSEAMRLLLHSALGDDVQKAAVREAILTFSGLRQLVFKKLVKRLDALLPEVLREAEAEAAAAEDGTV